jgi:RNA polymerase sigma-70 factor (ECF subfamily)
MTFEETYNKFSKLVFNLALQYVQNTEDAEEITQDVFVSVHQSLKLFQQNSEIKTWIYRIAINKSLDFIKAKNRKKRFAFISSLFHNDSNELINFSHHFNHPGILLEQKETVGIIFQHINLLPNKQKTVLILSKLEQKSQKEIAEIMNLSVKAVESLLHRAKTNLAKKLNSSEGK